MRELLHDVLGVMSGISVCIICAFFVGVFGYAILFGGPNPLYAILFGLT
jgi:hypothetical protein